MQKIPFSRIFSESLLRAFLFSIAFVGFSVLGFVGIVSAANGGIFGETLNRILASWNWETDTTGVVKNTLKLGGVDADQYVKVWWTLTCPANQCISAIDAGGSVICD